MVFSATGSYPLSSGGQARVMAAACIVLADLTNNSRGDNPHLTLKVIGQAMLLGQTLCPVYGNSI